MGHVPFGGARGRVLMTCERCGAENIDAQGTCQTCGWRQSTAARAFESSPSLGETRAADVPPDSPAPTSGTSGTRTGTATSFGAPSDTRYCGNCGARLDTGAAFCGQCGAPTRPTTQAPFEAPTRQTPADSSRYHVGIDSGWHTEEANALTEAIPDVPVGGYPRGGLRSQAGPAYSPAAYPSRPGGAATRTDGSRSTRIVFGIVCLAGSIASASVAVILALTSQPR